MANRIVLNETSYFGWGSRSVLPEEIRRRKYKKALLVGIMLTIVFILNDFSRKLIESVGGAKTYYRFLWIIPVTLVIAYVLTDLFDRYKQRFDRVVIASVLFSIVMISITFVQPYRGMIIPQNKYNNQEHHQ